MINIEATKPKIKELAEKYGLSLVVLFGSQATGKTHKESDVDIAYVSSDKRKISFDDEVLLNTDLTEVFRNDQVSLVNLKTANPLLARQITEKGIPLYQYDSSLFSQFIAYTLRIYEEAQSIFELRSHYLDHVISQYKHA